jgi:large subunit ribosomal protein L23
MNEARLMKILLGPVVSEKGSRISDRHRQFIFKVLKDASKPEIRRAVELMFRVKVQGVQVANMRGKMKRFGQMLGKRANWKKAYVTLEPGHDINFTDAG